MHHHNMHKLNSTVMHIINKHKMHAAQPKIIIKIKFQILGRYNTGLGKDLRIGAIVEGFHRVDEVSSSTKR